MRRTAKQEGALLPKICTVFPQIIPAILFILCSRHLLSLSQRPWKEKCLGVFEEIIQIVCLKSVGFCATYVD